MQVPPVKDRSIKRLRKKTKKGLRGWPLATIAHYGPNMDRASKVVVSIVSYEGAEPANMRKWFSEVGDVRKDSAIIAEILEHLQDHGVLSVSMTDRIIGCPHEEGIDYDGEWCPVCDYWRGRDRFTGEIIH